MYEYKIREVCMMKKRILLILLALCVFLCAVPTYADEWDDDDDWLDDDHGSAFEEEAGTSDFRTIAGYDMGERFVCGDYVYQMTEDGEGALLTNYSGTSGDVVTPETVDGHPVVAVGAHMFAYNEAVESVKLPEGIRSIGNMAFFKCTHLQGIEIPEGVSMIDECCFGGCEALSEVKLPSSLEEVGRFGFLACTQLKEIVFGDELKAIVPGAFQMCASLSKVSIPAGQNVTIEEDSFAGCSPELQILY